MAPKVAPVEKAIRILLLAIIVGYILTHLSATLATGFLPGFLAGLSTTLLIACLLEGYKAYRNYRAGFLFPIRGISFYMGLIAVIFGTVWLIYEIAVGSPEALRALLWLGVLAGTFVLSMPYLYLDSVRIEHRIGFTTTVLPLFSVRRIVEDDDRILIQGSEGLELSVYEGQVGAERFHELRTRVIAIK